jgi:hypothetical protein
MLKRMLFLCSVLSVFVLLQPSANAASILDWTLTRGGVDVAVSDYIDGNSIRFTTKGNYALTASVTDATGRVFSKTASTTVYPILNCDFSVPANIHIGQSIVVSMGTDVLLDGNNIVWTLTRSGTAANYTGPLGNSGGSINVNTTGSYTLLATVTDDLGRSFTCTKDFTIFNNPPSTPTITKNPAGSFVFQNETVTLTALSIDPDGDTVTYEWENRLSTYPLGTHTIRAKAVDQWGAESAWATTTFTSAVLSELGTLNVFYPLRLFEWKEDGRAISRYRLDFNSITFRAGYTYEGIFRLYNRFTGLWEETRIDVSVTKFVMSSYLPQHYTILQMGLSTNDPLVSNVWLPFLVEYYYP